MRRTVSRSVTWLVLGALLSGCGAAPITQQRLDSCQDDARVADALERLSINDTCLLRLEDGRFIELTVSRIARDALEGSGREIVREDDVYARSDAAPMVIPRAHIVAVCTAPRGYKPTPWLLLGVGSVVVVVVLAGMCIHALGEGLSHLN